MKSHIHLFFLITIVIAGACNSIKKKPTKTDPAIKQKRTVQMDTSFESRIYLEISSLYSNYTFEDAKTGKDVFFRVFTVDQEELIMVYVEKISFDELSGDYQLVERYRLGEKMLGMPDFTLYELDSLNFIDSINMSAYFNHIKYKINLDKKIVTKE